MAHLSENNFNQSQEKYIKIEERSLKPSFIEETEIIALDDEPDQKECFLAMFNPFTVIPKKFHAGGIKSTIITLISGTLGAGCLSMPAAFRASGIAYSIGQLFLGAWFSYLSLLCLVYCGAKTDLYSYGELAEYSGGKSLRLFVDIVYFVNNFGTLVSYSI